MAEEVTSGIVFRNINGSDRLFRTVTTHENSEVQKTLIQEVISEDLYDQRVADGNSSLVAKDDNGLFYQTVRNDGANTIFTDINLEKSLAETGNNSFLSNLNSASIDALVDNTNEERSVWEDSYSQFNNVADAGDANDGGGILPPSQPREFDLDRLEIKGKRQTTYENLFYPEDIVSSKQDKIKFTMFHQTGRSFNFNLSNPDGNPFTFGSRDVTDIDGSVTLPIQGGIQDNNTVKFGGSRLNPVTGALASIAFNPIAAGAQILNVLNQDVSQLQEQLGGEVSQNAIAAIRTYLAQTAVGTSGLIPRTTGAILNPNLELLLETPELRSFQFNFRMSARSRKEATQIKKIIRFFKQGMSVKRSASSLFVVTPNLFRIRYLTGDRSDHPSIGRIKDCALTSINTQYTPDGTYMTFDDEEKTMTSYQINMTFQELEPLTEEDYTTRSLSPNDNQIGF
tara:strand:- start:14 stop:1375 length:1362 start_codon:yes stop_codon:yes gene_type:complete